MELNFYKTNDAENVINKTLTGKLSLTVHFRNDVDIINPVLILAGEKLDGYNYAEIPHFNRYYFVERVESVGYNLWRVTLSCDVLESYKASILGSVGRYRRNLKTGDYQKLNLEESAISSVTVINSSKGLVEGEAMVLTTLGKGVD